MALGQVYHNGNRFVDPVNRGRTSGFYQNDTEEEMVSTDSKCKKTAKRILAGFFSELVGLPALSVAGALILANYPVKILTCGRINPFKWLSRGLCAIATNLLLVAANKN